jgi:YegS/Rv2252/BmrU family lipid kinase
MSTLLLLNPAAGHGHAGRVLAETRAAATEAWGAVDVAETRAPGDAVGLAEAAARAGATRVLVIGGDGTVHEAANGIMRLPPGARPALGVIPAGTGNDFAKLAGSLHGRPADKVRRLAGGRVRRIDVGLAWGEYFLNSVGIGFDAAVARQVNLSTWGRGIPAYLAAVGKVIRQFHPFEAQVTAEHEDFRDRFLLLEVGNGPVVGGGFRITPLAVPDDGVLDVCAVEALSTLGILAKLPLVMLGKHLGQKEVRSFRTRRIAVQGFGRPLDAQFDGELRSSSDRMEIGLDPAALPVMVSR